jgi:hypothetical protein
LKDSKNDRVLLLEVESRHYVQVKIEKGEGEEEEVDEIDLSVQGHFEEEYNTD